MTPRHHAREVTLQILYLWHMSGTDPARAVEAFFDEHEPDADAATRAFAALTVPRVAESSAVLDDLIARHTHNWRIERLPVIDRLILRLGAWELQHEPSTPRPVVINEALELARTFGSDDSVRFVNGVLDGIRKSLETQA